MHPEAQQQQLQVFEKSLVFRDELDRFTGHLAVGTEQPAQHVLLRRQPGREEVVADAPRPPVLEAQERFKPADEAAVGEGGGEGVTVLAGGRTRYCGSVEALALRALAGFAEQWELRLERAA